MLSSNTNQIAMYQAIYNIIYNCLLTILLMVHVDIVFNFTFIFSKYAIINIDYRNFRNYLNHIYINITFINNLIDWKSDN